jgi:hypothetical protein
MMEIVVETQDDYSTPPPLPFLFYAQEGVRKPPPVLASMVAKPYEGDPDIPLCETMTWDSALSPHFVAHAWPGRNVQFVRCGRAFAPITEIPIAQIPYLVIVAKYFTQSTITNGLQPFLNRKLSVALRDIDWLMVNYSKQFDSAYFLSKQRHRSSLSFSPKCELVSIYEMYNSTLHMYRRRHFRTYK